MTATATKAKKKSKRTGLGIDPDLSQFRNEAKKPPAPRPWADWDDQEISLASIEDDGRNHREPTKQEKEELAQLAESIKETNGVMQPIAVQKGDGKKFLRVFGSRRCAASKLAGFSTIWAKVSPRPLTEAEVQLYRTIENSDRRELNPAERTLQAHRLVEANRTTMSLPGAIKWAAAKLHTTEDKVGKMLNIVDRLGPKTRAILAAGGIHLGHAEVLAELGDHEDQAGIAQEIADAAQPNEDQRGAQSSGRLWSVQETRNVISFRKHSLSVVPWDLNTVVPGRPNGRTACAGCPCNTASKPTLPGMPDIFAENKKKGGDGEGAGTCTDVVCFEKSRQLYDKAVEKGLEKLKAKIKSKDLPKQEAASAAEVRSVMPDFVKESSAQRFIKKELGINGEKKPAAAGDANEAGAKGGGGEGEKKVTEKDKAKEKARGAFLTWGMAYAKWVDALTKAIVARTEKERAAKAAAFLLSYCDLPAFSYPTQSWEAQNKTEPDEEKLLTPAQSRLLDAAGAQQLESLLILAEAINPQIDEYDLVFRPFTSDTLEIGPELGRRLAKAFGVTVDEPPAYADFLKDEKPAKK